MTGFAEDNVPAYEAPMTKAVFLHWVQGREGRFELKSGRVIMQAGGTKRHNWITKNIVVALDKCLDPDNWATGIIDIAVQIGEDVRYPDVLVERLQNDGGALSTERPVVLVEVLSPSSVGTDMTMKLAEYTSLPSLEAYIVASQDEPICWLWQRGGENREFPAKPSEIKGREAMIEISALCISIPLAEIYRGIGTA